MNEENFDALNKVLSLQEKEMEERIKKKIDSELKNAE